MSNRKGKKQPLQASLANLLPEEKLVYHVKNSSKISVLNQLVEEHPDVDFNHLLFDSAVTEEELDSNLGIMPIDSVLTLACRLGNLDLVKWLLEKGSDKYVVLQGKTTLFHIVAEKNSEGLFKVLLEDETFIDLNDIENEEGETPFQISLLKFNNSNICSLCLRKGTFFNFSLKDEDGRMLIHNVARQGNTKLIECLLNLGDSPYKLDEEENTVLHHVLLGNDNKTKKQILELLNKRIRLSPQMLNAENSRGETPLWICFSSDDFGDLAKYLIKMGGNIMHVSQKTGLGLIHQNVVDDSIKVLSECFSTFKIKPSVKDGHGNYPMHYCKTEKVLKLLMEKKADFNLLNDEGYSPLANFIVMGYTQLVRILGSEKKSNLKKTVTKRKQNVLHLCAKYGREEIFELFFDHTLKVINSGINALVESEDMNGLTPLEVGIEERQEAVAIKLIQREANVLREKYNLIHKAVKYGLSRLVVEMIKNSAHNIESLINRFDDLQRTPLHDAVALNDEISVKALLSTNNVELDIVEKENNSTPLMIACRSGFSAIALLLLEAKSSTNFSDDRGRTALHYASSSKNVEVSKILIEKGSLINFTDRAGRTPLHEACSVNNEVVVDYLMEKNADIEIKDNDGFTPLHVAVKNGAVDATKKLLEKNALVNVVDNMGRTPLIVASQTKNTACGRLLVQYAQRLKSKGS